MNKKIEKRIKKFVVDEICHIAYAYPDNKHSDDFANLGKLKETLDINFDDIGFDSLDKTSLICAVESRFAIDFDKIEFEDDVFPFYERAKTVKMFLDLTYDAIEKQNLDIKF